MDYSLFDLIPEPVLVVDKNYNIIFANKKAIEEYEIKSILNSQTCYEVSHGFPMPCYEYGEHPCPVKIMKDSGIDKCGVVHIHNTKEGKKYFYVLASYDPQRDVYIEFHIEVSKLYDALKSYTPLFFEGPAVLFQWKRSEGWPVEFVSPNVVNLLGYGPEDFLSGRVNYAQLIHPEDLATVIEEVEYHTKNKSSSWTHKNYRLRRKDGEYIWVLDHTIPIMEEGEITGYLGYIIDISERCEKEEIFRLLAENNPYGVIIYDFHQNKILYANPNLEKITGYSLRELMEMPDILDLVHPEDRNVAEEKLTNRIQGYKQGMRYRIRIKSKSGSIKYLEIYSVVTQYGGKDVSFITLKDITGDIKRERKYIRLATTDPLTKIYNRHMILESLECLIQEARRYKEVFSVLMFDIDNFKRLNDTYGHLMGDLVLKEIASAIKKVIRKSDIFGRYGGEEFLLLLPKTNDPYLVGEKIRNVVRSLRFGNGLKVSISVGGAVYREGDTADSIIHKADKALYKAKRLGKDKTVVIH